MKTPTIFPNRVSRFAVAALLLVLTGIVWFRVIKEAVKEDPDPRAREYGITKYYLTKDGFRHDAVELTPEFQKAARELKLEISEATDQSGLNMGKVHFADRLLQDLLRKRYAIEWRTLQEMNPEVMID